MSVIAFPFVWLSYERVRARGRKSARAVRSDMFMGGPLCRRESGSREHGAGRQGAPRFKDLILNF